MDKDEIEIKLTKDQYIALVKLLHFADYCASNSLISEFKNSIISKNITSAIDAFYKPAININKGSSFSLNSCSSKVPFTDEEALIRQKIIEADLDQISNLILASEFAKKDLNLPKNEYLFDYEGGWESRNELIFETMQPYILEFNKNGISNLKFKLFYTLPEIEI